MFKQKLTLWVEKYFFYPSFFQILLSFLLLPLSLLYFFIVFFKRFFASQEDFGLAVVSVGNLTVGGSGKTPFLLCIAKDYDKAAIILRGYKRASKGLKVVSLFGKVKQTLDASGDEAMLYALSLPKALVIVSEDRKKALQKAKELGAKVAFLDDGFSKSTIKKFDILLRPNPAPKLPFTLPSGAYREPKWVERYANIALEEGADYERKTCITNKSENMVLVTAIANAKRLDKFLPKSVKEKFIFPDHHAFSKKELEDILKKTKATSLLVTRKDWVKVKDFGLPLSFLELELIVHENIKKSIKYYILKHT